MFAQLTQRASIAFNMLLNAKIGVMQFLRPLYIHLPTVMHEIGANIGYIISKHGFQSGAHGYIKNTNIAVLTFEEFQKNYLETWLKKYFIPQIRQAADSLLQYIEPVNSFRERHVSKLSQELRNRYMDLYQEYSPFGSSLAVFCAWDIYPKLMIPINDLSIDILNNLIQESIGVDARIEARHFREFLQGFLGVINNITDQFVAIFGENIFAD